MPDPVRIAQGWTRRFVVEARRAQEYIRLYESLGYEACADPVLSEQVAESCVNCRAALFLDFRAIYTRKPPHTEVAGAGLPKSPGSASR